MATGTAGSRSGRPSYAAGGGDRRPLVVAGSARDVRFGNRRHFRVLQHRSEEGIASNILADRLRGLVTAGLLMRAEVGPAQPPGHPDAPRARQLPADRDPAL